MLNPDLTIPYLQEGLKNHRQLIQDARALSVRQGEAFLAMSKGVASFYGEAHQAVSADSLCVHMLHCIGRTHCDCMDPQEEVNVLDGFFCILSNRHSSVKWN